MRTHHLAWLGLLGLAASCAPSAVCIADEDCAAFGPGSRCVVGERDEGLCSEPDVTGDGGDPSADGGPSPDDGGPQDIAVSVTLSSTSAEAGESVMLSWSSAPMASACEVTAKGARDASYAAVSGAGSGGAGEVSVSALQDTSFLVSCTLLDKSGSGEASLDVLASGSLTASASELNAGAEVSLSWETFGASSCSLHDASGEEVHAISSSTVELGSHALPAASESYALLCDGASLGAVSLTLASVAIDEVLPEALGPEPTVVSVVYTYSGPSAASCELLLDGAAVVDEDGSTSGIQVTLSSSAELVLSCDGFGAPVTAVVSVPRLIESFSGPSSPVPHGATAELSYVSASGASCEVLDVLGSGASPVTLPAQSATTTYTLECSAAGKTAAASVTVEVLPGVLSGLSATLTKTAPSVAEADVVFTTTATANATACIVSGGHFGDPEAMSGPDASGTFTLIAAAGASTGPESYAVTCESDPGLEAAGVSDAIVWWGVLDVADFSAFSSSGATLVTGKADLAGASALSSLSLLEEVGADLVIQSVSVDRLIGLESLTVVHGSLFVRSNPVLEELSGLTADRGLHRLREVRGSVIIGAASELNPSLQTAKLAELTTVGGGLSITDNQNLTAISMSALTSVGQGLSVTGNQNLTTISMSALTTVGGAFSLSGSPGLIDQASSSDGFLLLSSVDGAFTLSQTGLPSLTAYFPQLTNIGGSPFTVGSNASLSCTNIEEFYCGLASPPPPAVTLNQGGCGWAQAPACN